MNSTKVDFSVPADLTRIQNRTIFVTGGSDGIGAGLVRALASAGAYVVFGDINSTKGEALEKEMNCQGLKSRFIQLDVARWDSQVNAFKSALLFSPHGSLDMVFLNAGIAAPSFLSGFEEQVKTDAEPVDPALKVYDVNLTGLVRGVALAVHYFKIPAALTASSQSPEPKSIVLTGSLASYLASPTSETYGSSKFGVRGLFKGLRKSLPNLDIRINMMAPTYVRTALMSPIEQKMRSQGIQLIEVETVVHAMLQVACDPSIQGRSIGIGPQGSFDFCDDFAGHDGFYALQDFIESGALGESIVTELRTSLNKSGPVK